VQVVNDGQCIVLGVDGQTIGGYPKVAHVIGADLDSLGQLRPGDEIVFEQATLEEAASAWRERRRALEAWVARLTA
jgi:antagonist of KipI